MEVNKDIFTEQAKLPSKYGDFDLIALADSTEDQMPHLVLKHEQIDLSKPVTMRIHSECITGDLFGSLRCDCGEQLDQSMKIIAEEKGLLIYLRQEGRGIGILNKLKAYNLQDEGMDTIKANTHLGLEADGRAYDIAINILNALQVKEVKLLTNNPEKIKAFDESQIKVIERIPISIPANDTNSKYLKTKKDQMGHFL